MRFVFEENQALGSLGERFARVVTALLENVEAHSPRKLFPAETDLSAEAQGLYVVREGVFSASLNQRALFFYEEGDAIFVLGQQSESPCVTSDFATRCDFYAIESIPFSQQQRSSLLECLVLQQQITTHIVALLFKGERQSNPAMRSVRAGEVILTEGEISDQVFTLLEGHASVSSAGEIVGEVNADELIGVIGALCQTPRIATVTATKDSLLMSLGKDDFIELLSLRPHTVIKLIEDFARIISSSNQELRALKTGPR